jgi:hypothetical protein
VTPGLASLGDAVDPPSGGADGALGGPVTAHLSRFNAEQLAAIERAIAKCLQVNSEHLAAHGFSVMRESDDSFRVTWEASAAIPITEFQLLVEAATQGYEPTSWRPLLKLPPPHGPAEVSPRRPRRSRRRDPISPAASDDD